MMAAVTDIVTLDNFEAKMPKWAPDLPSHLYALVDMGRFVTPRLVPVACRPGVFGTG